MTFLQCEIQISFGYYYYFFFRRIILTKSDFHFFSTNVFYKPAIIENAYARDLSTCSQDLADSQELKFTLNLHHIFSLLLPIYFFVTVVLQVSFFLTVKYKKMLHSPKCRLVPHIPKITFFYCFMQIRGDGCFVNSPYGESNRHGFYQNDSFPHFFWSSGANVTSLTHVFLLSHLFFFR